MEVACSIYHYEVEDTKSLRLEHLKPSLATCKDVYAKLEAIPDGITKPRKSFCYSPFTSAFVNEVKCPSEFDLFKVDPNRFKFQARLPSVSEYIAMLDSNDPRVTESEDYNLLY